MTDDVAAAFDETQQGYGTQGDFHARYAEALVAEVRLQPGELVLDVATGTGPAAIAAASIVGSTGHVTGVDISPGMLAQARRNVAAAGAPREIELLEADGAQLPFAPGTFDVVICASSLVWFSDMHAALNEWRRVIRPGGRLDFSTPAASGLPLGRLFRTHLRGYGIDLPDITAPLDTAEKCRRAVGEAGFNQVAVHTWQWSRTLASVDDAVAAGAIALAPDPDGGLAGESARHQPVSFWASLRRGMPIPVPLTAAQLDQLHSDFRSEVGKLTTPEGIANSATSLLVVAHRP